MAQARMIDDLVGEQISLGLQLSVICTEDAPLLVANPADADTLLGIDLRRRHQGRSARSGHAADARGFPRAAHAATDRRCCCPASSTR